MAKVLVEETNLEDIADSIRAKNGTQETYLPSEMATAISNIPSGGGGTDWSEIGYSETPQAITDGFNYAKQIYDNWDASQTLMNNKYQGDKNISIFPLVDTQNIKSLYYAFTNSTVTEIPALNTSKVTEARYAFMSCAGLKKIGQIDTSKITNLTMTFYECGALKDLPIFDFSSVTVFTSTFTNCPSLSDSSLNNLLYSLSTASNVSSKTLKAVGLSQSQATTCTTLTNWSVAQSAGWTTGY